ncbi:hypothetical protein HOLleu_36439 [Holothuria leucospilota]|uniref:Transmembrane protein n=1 Tax=Holothuria leucospilota TaxID=206669 RepID=A0A9Q0YJZ9_HOLLE|nr:hypothetical protein HOLleu_36439 [Holothuria leucospilota]
MELQKQNEVVITQQPQSVPSYVVIQTAPRNNVPAIGALVFSLVTLVCCPGSLFCTIPSCICAIVALKGDGSDSEKTMYITSFITTAAFWILAVISAIILVILAVARVFAAASASINDHFDYIYDYFNNNNPFENVDSNINNYDPFDYFDNIFNNNK